MNARIPFRCPRCGLVSFNANDAREGYCAACHEWTGYTGPKPWEHEPDRIAWRDPATGYQCMILRHEELGSLCGYVRAPRDHALHRVDYRRRRVSRALRPHGGLTFSGCIGGRRMKRGHWFGFDCAHAWDMVPMLAHITPDATYRTVNYVRAECTELAGQLARAGRKG